MKKLLTIAFMTSMAFLIWLGSGSISNYFQNYEYSFCSIEERVSVENIIKKQRSSIIKNSKYNLMEPTKEYYPFALAHVKYLKSDGQTEEGQILWGLANGEMVLDTSSWSMSKGFADCLRANVNANELKIITEIIENGVDRSTMSIEALERKCKNKSALESCLNKRIVQIHNENYALHINKPTFPSVPFTNIRESMVTKKEKKPIFITKKYRLDDIQILLQNLFGNNLTVHSIETIYLPVHAVHVENPDKSIRTHRFNGVNGLLYS
jgi:hypothetical protein